MKFSEVAEYFEKVENTTKRLEMFEILSELFKKTPKDEIDKLIYIAQERILPSFEGVEIGMAERMLEKAISRAMGADLKRVKELYKKKGDLGLAAEELAKKQSQKLVKPKELSLAEVYNGFFQAAKVSGSGAVDQKINVITGLLSRASPIESRYISRFVIGRLRLGIGSPTLMDSLSKAKVGDRSLRKALENAYNLCSDLGLVAKTFFEKGEKGLKSFKITPGKPVRMALAERLPSPVDIIKKIGKCAIEAKYDGFRCISGYTMIYEKTRGILPVRDIKKGDMVLTHKGKFKKVIAKKSRVIDRTERIFSLQTRLGDKFKITEKHPMLCFREGKQRWVSAENLSDKDKLMFPIPRFSYPPVQETREFKTNSGYVKTIKFDENFFRFLGFWIGDGYTNEYNRTSRIGLIFNAKTEKKMCAWYKNYICNAFNIEHIYENLHNGAIYLYWDDKPFLQWLSKNFRKPWKSGWRGKTIPAWFFGLDKLRYKAFLKGWIESDGHIDSYSRTSIVTKESDLAAFNQLLALKHGIILGIKKFRVNDATYYKLIVTKGNNFAKIEGNFLIVKLYKLHELKRTHPREVDPRQVVYNLQVDEDESYCVPLVALHNCQLHKEGNKIQIFSRNLENMTHMFPDVVESAKKYIKAKDAIIEGEALVYNEVTGELMPFQVTITRKRKYDIEEKKKELPLKLFVFDLLYADGKDYTPEPYEKRIKAIEKYVEKSETMDYAQRIITDDPEKIKDFFETAVTAGLEGVMAKRLDAPYSAGGRNYDWIKLKRSYKAELSDTVDVVIIGYLKGKGMRAKFGIGAVLGAVYNKKDDVFESICKVGSGFSEENWVKIRKELDNFKLSKKSPRVESDLIPDVWVEPKLVIEITADEITTSPLHTAGKKRKEDSGYALRFPRVKGYIRYDKKPEDATTVEEIKKMYKQQTQMSKNKRR